jgi:hypothetical protein
MNNPEAGLPMDPFLKKDFPMSPELQSMFSLGVSRGIIEQLAANDFAVEAYVLARNCKQKRELGDEETWIDECAIGFVATIDEKIHEDALVAMIILHPELDIKL